MPVSHVKRSSSRTCLVDFQAGHAAVVRNSRSRRLTFHHHPPVRLPCSRQAHRAASVGNTHADANRKPSGCRMRPDIYSVTGTPGQPQC